MSSRIRAIHIVRPGRPECAFEIQRLDRPEPGPNDVVIDVRAAGVNFADVLARRGVYPEAPPVPCVVGYEVAGVIEEVGSDVDTTLIGKEVIALTDFGGYAEAVRVDRHYVWEKPEGLTFEQAAVLPLNYITAWGLLVAMGGLKSGETVLIHNAGGGVGLAAMEIARHVGARVLGSASPRKHDFLLKRGLDHAIDYTRPNWPDEVMRLTDGKGVELALDPIVGAHWKQTFDVLRATGRMGMFGVSGAAKGNSPFAKIAMLRLFVTSPRYHIGNLISTNRGVFAINIHAMYADW